MGRPRKPDHLKLVTGTLKPCRSNAAAPKGDLVLLEAPAWLNPNAREIFIELAAILFELGVTMSGDRTALALLASRLDEVRVTTGIIEDLGGTYRTKATSGDTLLKRHPAVAMRAEAMRHAQSLLNDFGLSPAARSRVVAVVSGKTSNPFDQV